MEKPDFEKRIPLPEKDEYRRSKYYWLAHMEVGDSFTCSHQDYKRIGRRFNTPVSWLPENFKIATRKIDNGLYRIWRIS